VQELAEHVVREYDGQAERLWTEAESGDDLRRRIAALPGFGRMKIVVLGAVLAKRFGVSVAEELVPDHPTLGDVDSDEKREWYQEKKRAYKAAMRGKPS
jgi:hypothetical protein